MQCALQAMWKSLHLPMCPEYEAMGASTVSWHCAWHPFSHSQASSYILTLTQSLHGLNTRQIYVQFQFLRFTYITVAAADKNLSCIYKAGSGLGKHPWNEVLVYHLMTSSQNELCTGVMSGGDGFTWGGFPETSPGGVTSKWSWGRERAVVWTSAGQPT